MNALRVLLQYITAPFRLLVQAPANLIGAPRRLMGMSLPARVATLLAIFLVTCTLTVVVVFTLRRDVPHAEILLNPKWIISILAVLIATPIATYYLLRLWLEGDKSRFPDIDRAWDEGIAALAENSIGVCDLPLYLVLGAGDEGLCDRLIGAARLNPIVSGAPKGRSPLKWYATDEAIYLFCRGVGRLSRLCELGGAVAAPSAAATAAQPQGDMRSTMVVGAGSIRQSDAPQSLAGPQPAAEAPSPAIYGTLVPGAALPTGGTAAPASMGSLTRKEGEEQSQRLEYLCQRMARARQPFCADNGVMTVLPLPALTDVLIAKEIPDAVMHDVKSIRETTQLVSPVTALVVSMEGDDGFSELVHRVGLDRARSSRFGKGYDVWSPATDENLDALSSHACGAFEDWVYTLFAAADGLKQAGNGKLFGMLCRVRRHLQPRLRSVLVRAYAVEGDAEDGEPQLFSGCYFAATGASPNDQAFVRSVFEKLSQLSEDLQWRNDAIRSEHWFRTLAQLAIVLNVGLLITVGVLAYRYFMS